MTEKSVAREEAGSQRIVCLSRSGSSQNCEHVIRVIFLFVFLTYFLFDIT